MAYAKLRGLVTDFIKSLTHGFKPLEISGPMDGLTDTIQVVQAEDSWQSFGNKME